MQTREIRSNSHYSIFYSNDDNRQICMRDYKITRNKGEWYRVDVVDSYGNPYYNFFKHAHEANDWIYWVWDNEDWFNSANSQELLANGIILLQF